MHRNVPDWKSSRCDDNKLVIKATTRHRHVIILLFYFNSRGGKTAIGSSVAHDIQSRRRIKFNKGCRTSHIHVYIRMLLALNLVL
jgi:hypothetical protein